MIQGTRDIFKELERRIVQLDLQPGQLINEKQLIEEFGVSRTPIREALLKLSEKGFVDMIPRVGTYVSQIDIKTIKYVYEVKKHLEALASELAAQRASAEEIGELMKITARINGYDAVKDYKRYIEDDYLFRKVIRLASKNPVLIAELEELNVKTERFVQHIQYKIGDPSWYNESLKGIAEAIEKRDKDTAAKESLKHAEIFLEELSRDFFF